MASRTQFKSKQPDLLKSKPKKRVKDITGKKGTTYRKRKLRLITLSRLSSVAKRPAAFLKKKSKFLKKRS